MDAAPKHLYLALAALLVVLLAGCGKDEPAHSEYGPPSPPTPPGMETPKPKRSPIGKATSYVVDTAEGLRDRLAATEEPATAVGKARGYLRIRAPRTSASMVRVKTAREERGTSRKDLETIATAMERRGKAVSVASEQLSVLARGASAELARDIQTLSLEMKHLFGDGK
jgi:hypothetical protein